MKRKLRLFSIMLIMLFSCCLFTACGSDKTLTIKFDSNGGSNCNSIVYYIGKDLKMPENPTKENYIFGGWYSDNGEWQEEFTLNTILNYPLSKNTEITVYAKWLSIDYIINFDSNGGSVCDDILVDYLDIELPTTQKDGYQFKGWYFDNITFENQFSTYHPIELSNNEITLYACWERNLEVNFHLNNGKENVVKYYKGDTFVFPENFIKDCFDFVGWSFSESENIEFDLYSIEEYEKNGKIDLYAVWQENEILSVQLYDRGNVKEFYFWGDEIDLSQTKVKINYINGKSRITNILENELISSNKYYAKYNLDYGNTIRPQTFEQQYKYPYTPNTLSICYTPATFYIDIDYNIFISLKNARLINYNEFVNYNDNSVLFTEETKLLVEDYDGNTMTYNLLELGNINEDDIYISNIDRNVEIPNYMSITSANSIISGFENNTPYVDKKLTIRYKTISFTIDYKVLYEQIDEINLCYNDFYPTNWTYNEDYNKDIGGIVGGLGQWYKLRKETVSLSNKDNTNNVKIIIKFNNGKEVTNLLENIFLNNDDGCFQILEDIYFVEENAYTTIEINGIEYNLTLNVPITISK